MPSHYLHYSLWRLPVQKLPFRISSAPELLQKGMGQILSELKGVVCLIDDVITFGKNIIDNYVSVTAVLRCIEAAVSTLNVDKCMFHQRRLNYLGHVLDEHGVYSDPRKISVLSKPPAPKNITDLHRFFGVVNQLEKFSP